MSRQNAYDDPMFFPRYREMRETDGGYNGTLEMPAVRSLLPGLFGVDCLDLGCGAGALAWELVDRGARSVIAVDPSERMLELAGARQHSAIQFRQAFAEDVDLPAASVDLLVSSLVLHYLDNESFGSLWRRAARWLRRDGVAVVSMEHPFRTALHGVDGSAERGYFVEGRRDTSWLGTSVIKYHRRLETIVGAISDAGLVLERLLEPRVSDQLLAERPDLAEHRRVPPLLVLRARRPAST